MSNRGGVDATSTLRQQRRRCSLLRCRVPGTSDTFDGVLAAIARGSRPGKGPNFCYLIGGQVRDVLRGKLSIDIDFNYSCDAQEVALTTVAHRWPTKYKCIGEGVSPNYVLVRGRHAVGGFRLQQRLQQRRQ